MKKLFLLLGLVSIAAMAAEFDTVKIDSSLNLGYGTANTVPYLNSSKNFVSSAVGPTQLGYISTLSSNAQDQINALSAGTLHSITGTAPISITSGQNPVVSCIVATGSVSGCLSAADWNTFNGKQPAGNYLTAISGDLTASGPGSAVGTLATVNSNVGSFTLGNFTVNGKGLVTAASSTSVGNLTDAGTDGITVTSGSNAVLGSGTSISQHVADTTHSGYLSTTDWNTFNGKGSLSTLGAFGSSPNANGGSVSGSTLTLQPADGSHPGGVSLSAQTLGAGTKSFTSSINVDAPANTTGSINAKAMGAGLYQGLSLESPSSTWELGLNIRDDGTFFLWNGGYTVLSGTNSLLGNGPSGPAYWFDVNRADSNTTQTSPTANSGLGIRNVDTTTGNYSSLNFSNSNNVSSSLIEGVHVNQSTNQGSLNFLSRNSSGTLVSEATMDPVSGISTAIGIKDTALTASQAVVTDSGKNLISEAIGNLTDVGTDGITVTGGSGSVFGSGTSIAQHVADTTHAGYLASADWNTFNGKQPAGNYLTAISGDLTASGPGSAVGTLATVNSNVGSFTLGNFTVNGKGLVTAASSTSVGNLTDAGTDGITVTSGSNAVLGSGTSISQHVADTTHSGYLSTTDWNTFNGKQAAGSYVTAGTGDATFSGPGSAAVTLASVNTNIGSYPVSTVTVNAKGLVTAVSAGTTGNLTDTGTDGITVTGGTGAVLGSGTSISQHVADTTHAGYLASADWNTFNGKQASLTFGNLTDAGTDGITVTGGTGSVIGSGTSVSQHVADTTHAGYLASADWNTFNGKQAAGNYVTAGTGDATFSGPGSAAVTLATVNSNIGSFTNASVTVNGKGLVTAVSSGTAGLTNPMSNNTQIIAGGSRGTPVALSGVPNSVLVGAPSTGIPGYASVPGNTNILKAPTQTVLTSTGSVTGELFTTSSANATVGATYTNNSNTYTVLQTISSGTTLFMSGTGATSGSTLTKASGTGDATITFSNAQAMATYTTPTSPSPIYLEIEAVGGGGGGAASASVGSPAPGTTTAFGTNLIVCGGGGAGTSTTGATGGTAAVNSPASGIAVTGAPGQGATVNTNSSASSGGGQGGGSPFGGAGGGAGPNGSGTSASTNSGSGGGGAGQTTSASSGSGGGAGGYVRALVTAPSATYFYTIGAGGAGGSSTRNGGSGASGLIIVREKYQ